MRLGLLAIVSGVALSLSAAALAADPQAASQAQPAVAATPASASTTATSATTAAMPEDQKLVCHYKTHNGEIVKKICATQYEWDKERRRQEQEVRQNQMRRFSQPMRGG